MRPVEERDTDALIELFADLAAAEKSFGPMWTASQLTCPRTAGGSCPATDTRTQGGPDHYASYLGNDDGFEVGLVAR